MREEGWSLRDAVSPGYEAQTGREGSVQGTNEGLLPEIQGLNPAVTVLYVPSWLDSGQQGPPRAREDLRHLRPPAPRAQINVF